MLLFLMALLSAFAAPIDDVENLVAEPRVAGSLGGIKAQTYVHIQLVKQGWNVEINTLPHGGGYVRACQKGEGPAFWILAHTDTVGEGVPGAVDNAAAVAVALEVARQVRGMILPVRACFAFPDGEEVGLVGSRTLVRRLGDSERPAFVISLELLGQGELTAMGLGKHWGADGLSWLQGIGGVDIPFAYRVYSLLFPSLERSDHRPFAEDGIRAMMLLGRGESGVYWAYHTPKDDLSQVSEKALDDAVNVLMRMLEKGPPAGAGDLAVAIPWLPLVLPEILVWIGIGLGVLGGFLFGLRSWRTAIGALAWAGLAGFLAGLAVMATSFGRPTHGALASVSSWVWILVFFWVVLSSAFKEDGLASGALVCAWLAVGFCAIHPLLALPWAVSGLALVLSSRFWPLMLLALPFPLYVISGDLWRELVFHGVIPENPLWWMPVKILVMWPVVCVCSALRPMRGLMSHVAFGLVLLTLACLLFLSEPFSGNFFEREVTSTPRLVVK